MTRPSILVVDDDPDTGGALASLLESCGYEVTTATDGVAALAKITPCAPDIVITDIVIPKLSGVELCIELKANADTRRIPVIVCSGVVQPPPILAQPGIAYLSKPVDFDVLARINEELLGVSSKSAPDAAR